MNTIRELRKQRGLTQKELGNVIGVAESTISLYETGKRMPDADTLRMLAHFFGVTFDTLLGETAETRPVADKDIKFALFGGDSDITDEQFEEVKRYALYLKARNKHDNE